MNDDWRLQVDFVDEGLIDHLDDRLDAEELEHDLSGAFYDRVSGSDPRPPPEARSRSREPGARHAERPPNPFAFLGGLAG